MISAFLLVFAAYAFGSECPTCVGPKFSWETLPVAFHSAEASTNGFGEFSAAELATIVKFPIVTIEKWQGSSAADASGKPVFVWEEDAWVNAAKQIKSAKSDISVVVWLDSMRIYTGWWFPPSGHSGVNHTLNPIAKSSCATGHFEPAEFLERHDSYLARNASGGFAFDPWSYCHLFGFDGVDAQTYWHDMCLNLTRSGVIDGCGCDASWQTACGDAACSTTNFGMNATQARAWDNGKHAALLATTTSLGEGITFGKDPQELYDPESYFTDKRYVNGALHEGCDASESTIFALQNVTAAAKRDNTRLIYECHTYCSDPCTDEIAAFLIGAGEYQYFVTGGWTSSKADNGSFATHWLSVFEKPLGTPLTEGIYNPATKQWTRQFAAGTNVTFDATTNKGTIYWAS